MLRLIGLPDRFPNAKLKVSSHAVVCNSSIRFPSKSWEHDTYSYAEGCFQPLRVGHMWQPSPETTVPTYRKRKHQHQARFCNLHEHDSAHHTETQSQAVLWAWACCRNWAYWTFYCCKHYFFVCRNYFVIARNWQLWATIVRAHTYGFH